MAKKAKKRIVGTQEDTSSDTPITQDTIKVPKLERYESFRDYLRLCIELLPFMIVSLIVVLPKQFNEPNLYRLFTPNILLTVLVYLLFTHHKETFLNAKLFSYFYKASMVAISLLVLGFSLILWFGRETILSTVLLLAFMGINVFLFFVGFFGSTRPRWIDNPVYVCIMFLAGIIPLFLIQLGLILG